MLSEPSVLAGSRNRVHSVLVRNVAPDESVQVAFTDGDIESISPALQYLTTIPSIMTSGFAVVMRGPQSRDAIEKNDQTQPLLEDTGGLGQRVW